MTLHSKEIPSCPFCGAKVIQTEGAYSVMETKHIIYWEIIHKKGCYLYTDNETKTIIGVSESSKRSWITRDHVLKENKYVTHTNKTLTWVCDCGFRWEDDDDLHHSKCPKCFKHSNSVTRKSINLKRKRYASPHGS